MAESEKEKGMSDALQSSSGRSIRQTEAGREYQAELKTKAYKRQLQELRQLGSQVAQLSGHDAEAHPDISEESTKRWIHLYISFIQTENELRQLIRPAEVDRHSASHKKVLEEVDKIRVVAETYLRSIQPKKITASSSVASSSRSVRSDLQRLRIEDERKKAESAAKLVMLKTKRELERQRQELLWQEEELALKTEMEIQRRQAEVVNKFEAKFDDKPEVALDDEEEDPAANLQPPMRLDEEKKASLSEVYQSQPQVTDASAVNPEVDARHLVSHSDPPSNHPPEHTLAPGSGGLSFIENPAVVASSSTDLLSGLASLLSEQGKRISLPALEPEVFHGDAEHFHPWMKSFESYIEARTASPTERLHFLSRYTSGEARNAIQGFIHLNTGDAYDQAKLKLQERYGSNFITAQTYRKRIRTWPRIASSDAKGLQKFADYLESCEVASRTVTGLEVLSDPDENVRMLQLLPRHIVNRWERVVDESLYEPRPESPAVYPTLSVFVRFLKKEARIASGPIGIRLSEVEQSSPKGPPPKTKARTFLAAADTKSAVFESSRVRCRVCGEDHTLEQCQKFLQKGVKDRHDVVLKHGLCRGCLKPGHVWRTCKTKKRCTKCGRLHPTILHDDSLMRNEAEQSSTKKNESTQTSATSLHVGVTEGTVCAHSMVVPVRLRQAGRAEHETITYALLDLQSDACFIKESVRQSIHAEGEPTCLQLSTMTGKTLEKTHAVKDLVAQPVDGGADVALPTTYSRLDIPADRGLIPRKDSIQKWPHLKTVGQHLPPYFDEAEIGILIGINCAKAVKPLEVVSGEDHEPWAVKTVLGWSVVGILNSEPLSRQGEATSCHFAFRVHTREVSPEQLMHLFEADFHDNLEERKYSQEDMMFLDIMKEGIHQRADRHLEMPLPLRDPSFCFPDNKEVALKRLVSLKRRLARDLKFREEYETFMSEILETGYAEAVPLEGQEQDGHVWYVPHHGVYHPKKNKIRVVFDCSTEYKGVSLNQQLLQGPDVGNSLIGVLIRFRKEIVGLSCDVQGMFNQVGVNPEDRNLLRFLWWKQGDITADPDEYRMTTHLFGATSSPACAMIALQETANRHEVMFGTEAADFVRRDFYVDDGLTSVPDIESAVGLAKTTIDLCAAGGFVLRKFVSNEPEVLKRLPAQSCVSNLQEVEVPTEQPVMEYALGIKWNLKDDTLGFNMDLPERPPTRRGILSLVSSFYDPLGLVSPFTLQGKKILKQLCVDGCDWDDPVPEEVAMCWESWKSCLPRLSAVSVPRCYTAGLGQSPVKVYELHHFCDASLDGYGYCSYLRAIAEDGRMTSSLVMSKARVTSKRPLTVPRLELTAAVAAVKGSCLLRKELDITGIKEFFWTDSKVVLGYINNESKRFHVFVSNRIQQIRKATLPTQWRHVTTEDNPADLTSRGATLQELNDSDLWWTGPAFLSESEDLPGDIAETEVAENDPEVKRSSVFNTVVKNVSDKEPYVSLTKRLSYFSSWFRAKRAVALVLRYCKILLERVRSKHDQQKPQQRKSSVSPDQVAIGVDDLKKAEEVILKAAQSDSFSEELKRLKSPNENAVEGRRGSKQRYVKKNSSLFKLDPFVDNCGLLRVGGRLRRADVPFEVAHPVLLPNRSHVTDLVVRHIHAKVEHSGREATLSEVRQRGYWIIRGRSAVSRCILKCVKCIRLRGTPSVQKMSDLPRERMEAMEPFTFTGVDYFGPFYIREKRSEVKRWAVMFTCMSSRSVHLETANSLSADAFLNAYRRFVGRRGPVRRLYCDQGTNFVGGKSILEAALNEADHKQIKDELLKEECDWVEFHMNVPHASHMGGAWERQIRTARAVLSSILAKHSHSLDDELLRTVLVETEAIVNSLPLSYSSMVDTNTPEPLTPQQLLTLKSKVVCPLPGRFCNEDLYARQRWRRVQFLANVFWRRWRREFLPTLHQRGRWQAAEPNLCEGDVVIVVDDALPRGRWSLGRVVRTYPSEDGLVRKVRVRIRQSEYDRPVHRLILLMKADVRSEE